MHVFCQVVLVSIFRCKSRPVHAGRQRTGENNPEEEADRESMNAVFSDDHKNESCSMMSEPSMTAQGFLKSTTVRLDEVLAILTPEGPTRPSRCSGRRN